MNTELLFNILFNVVGGLGIFLVGMNYMRDGLQMIAGQTFRNLVHLMTSNRFMAVGVGTLTTCIVQSSSITTVMVVGLVNSELMTLTQSIGVIMGANVGTTITGWILAIKIGKYGLPLLGISAIIWLFSKKEKVKFLALAFLGIGMIFFGLELMKDGFKPLRDLQEFEAWFQVFHADSYFGVLKCALVGCILTLVVQSSSATLGITIGLASTGVIPFETAAALVLGENIGTTITAFIASLGTGAVAKRAAYFHILFNAIGVFWITLLFAPYLIIIKFFLGDNPNTMLLSGGEETYPYITAAIAFVHTGFNVTNTLIFLPFIHVFSKLLSRIGTEKKKHPRGSEYFTHLDFTIHDNPYVASEQSKHEIDRMEGHVQNMLTQLKTATLNLEDRSIVDKIFEREDILDHVQKEITTFLTDLLAETIPHDLAMEAQTQLRMADEYESISDDVAAILKLHLRLMENKVTMNQEQTQELTGLHEKVSNFFNFVHSSLKRSPKVHFDEADQLSQEIDVTVRNLRTQHWNRLSAGKVEPLVTTTYMDIANYYRRIKDHLFNVVEALSGEKFVR